MTETKEPAAPLAVVQLCHYYGITLDQAREIAARFRAGEGQAAIGRSMGWEVTHPEKRVRRLLVAMGIGNRQGEPAAGEDRAEEDAAGEETGATGEAPAPDGVLDERDVVRYYQADHTAQETAARFGMKEYAVGQILKRHRATRSHAERLALMQKQGRAPEPPGVRLKRQRAEAAAQAGPPAPGAVPPEEAPLTAAAPAPAAEVAPAAAPAPAAAVAPLAREAAAGTIEAAESEIERLTRSWQQYPSHRTAEEQALIDRGLWTAEADQVATASQRVINRMIRITSFVAVARLAARPKGFRMEHARRRLNDELSRLDEELIALDHALDRAEEVL